MQLAASVDAARRQAKARARAPLGPPLGHRAVRDRAPSPHVRDAPPLQGSKTPNVASWVMQEAYSHECASLGFWPGNGGYGRAAFYAYAYPEPDGFGAEPVRPQGAAYNADVGQFLIDYDAVRQAASPDDALLDFAQSTYEAAANRGGWDRKVLERHAGRYA